MNLYSNLRNFDKSYFNSFGYLTLGTGHVNNKIGQDKNAGDARRSDRSQTVYLQLSEQLHLKGGGGFPGMTATCELRVI